MNFRQSLLRFRATGCGLLVVFSLGLLPAGGFAAIENSIKISPDANTTQASIDQINAVVKADITQLTGDDAAKRQSARDALTGEVSAVNNQPLSSAFFETYSKALNTQLLPVFDLPDPKVRLNAAIVVTRVAEKVDNSFLLDVTQRMLADKSDAVVAWGLKASEFVLPPILQVGLPAKQKQFISDIKAHANSPIFVPLVYEALSLNYQATKGKVPNWNKMVQIVLPEVVGLLQARVKDFSKEIPLDPSADGPAAGFLVAAQVWAEATPPQRLQIIQLLSDLFSFAGHRAAVAGPKQAQLLQAAVQAAMAISAVAVTEHNPALQQQAEQISKTINPRNANMLQIVDSLFLS